MQELTFYIVFLSQIILISFVFPRIVLGKMKFIVETLSAGDPSSAVSGFC